MPDDERPGGTHSSANDANGYGRRHRRADEPSEKPRRRRRSMEDGQGGLSVADLVQRHGISRQDLSPVNPDAPGRRSSRRPVEGQTGRGRRPSEPTGGQQWPDDAGQPPEPHGRRVPPVPGQATGRRARPEPPDEGRRAQLDQHGYPQADVPPAGYDPAGPGQRSGSYPVPRPGQSSGGRALPPPGPVSGRRALPDESFGPAARHVAPDSGFGPAGYPAPDHGYSPADDYGPGGHDNGYGPADNGYGHGGHHGAEPRVGPNGDLGPGGLDHAYDSYEHGYEHPADHFGPGTGGNGGFGPGRRGSADEDFGGHRAAADNGFGPTDHGFGPSAARTPDEGFDPGGYRAVADNGFASADRGFGPSGPYAPDEGFGPADHGVRPSSPHAPDDGFGPADHGFGPGAPGGVDEGFGPAGFGPGQGTGRRPMPEGGFGPGQQSGPRPGPVVPGQGKVPPTGADPRPVYPGPGQSTGGPVLPLPPGPVGPSGMPPGPGQTSGGRAVPPAPGQSSGGRAVPPGQTSGGRPVPPAPGQNTGRRPIPEGGFGPGQSSGHHPIPPPVRHPSGPVPGDPAAMPPAEPMAGEGPPLPAARTGAEDAKRSRPGEPAGKVPLPPPRNPADAISMTTEMEAIGEEVQKRRGIDHTLARFSAVHDEIQAEERERKAKRRKLMPWKRHEEDDLEDKLDELVQQQTLSVPQKPQPQPEELVELVPGESDGGATRLQEKKSRRQNRSTLAIRVAAATAAILVFVATGIAWGFKSWVDASSQQVDALDPNSAAIQDAAKQSGDENFLLVGSDTRAGAEAEDGVGDDKEVIGARSDTVMIAHIPKNRERAVVVSFPRDLEVTRPACEGWDPKTGDYTGEQKPAAEQAKLNTAYQVGGPKCVTKLVQQLSGLRINHFVGIDFNGFKDMVDAVRGVQLCVEQPIKDDVLGTIVPQAGKNVTLTGDQALNFVRARHVQGDVTSDYGRIQRQQRFLSSLLRKVMSGEVLLDPGKLTNFVRAFSKSTFGDNIGVDQMFTLGQSLQGVNAGRVTFITVPTVGEANENGNEVLRDEDTQSLFRAIREDTPLPGETGGTQQLRQQAVTLQQNAPVDPKSVKLQVLNGGNPTGGIAGTTADQLAEFGYQIVWVDAAPENVKQTVIKYAKGREAQARLVQSSVPDAELVEDPSLAGAIQLVIGPGFDGNVVAPGKGEPAPPDLPDDLSTINGGDVSCI